MTVKYAVLPSQAIYHLLDRGERLTVCGRPVSRAHTTSERPENRPTTTVVRTGPYRYSRNPIYLSFSLLQLGIAFLVNSIWLLVTLIPAVLLMSLVVIPMEEAFLGARFPTEYLPYRGTVRRWL